jgi:hypothetical protein
LHQPALSHQSQVFGYVGLAQPKIVRQVAHRFLAANQFRDDEKPVGIRQRLAELRVEFIQSDSVQF